MRLETSISESRIDSFRYYHLSQDNNLTVLEPKVPDNFLTRNKYEDSKTPRVSFAPTINQCLMGMSENVAGNEYYVYIPYQIDYNKLVKPHTNQVPDCNITGEVWALQPVRVKCVGKIKVIGDAGLPGHPYTYGEDKIAHLYDWEYKVLVNENEVVGEAALMESLVLFPEDESEILEATAEDIALNNQLEPIFVVNTFTNTDFGRTMQKRTNAQYSHALISLDPYLRHMYSYDDEEVVVNGKTGLSDDYIDRYRSSEGGIMRVILIMVPPKVKQGIQNSINYYLKRADQTKYGYGNLFAWIKGSNKISSWGDLKLFCSEFVDMILKHNNIDITGKSSRNVHPDDLGTFKERSNAYLIYQGLIKNYNGRDMELAIEHLRNTVDHDKLNAITPKSMHARSDIILGKKNHIIPILKSFLPTRTAGTAAHREATAVIGTNGVIEKDSYYPLENISKDDDFELPGDQEYDELQGIQTLLDNADPKRVFLTSDWHFFKNHYKKEANYVNTMKILKWCKENIKDTDIFMYLGDLSFRYASDKDNEMALYYMSQIKGTKIFVLGNHDKMLGAEFFSKSGFDYVVEEIRWHNIIFTHKPINMDIYGDDALNIHGHIHNIRKYNTTDGKKNVNVYPLFYGNKPTTLDYVLNHVEELTKDNEWNPNAGYGESHHYDFHIPRGDAKTVTNIKKLAILTEQLESLKNKPTVYFSSDITPDNITRMVNFYRYKLNGSVAIKLHFGEEGNKNFLDPSLVKNLTETYTATLVDSNTAYEGSTRGTTEEHLKTAKKHGFDFAPIDILDTDGDIELSIPKVKEIEAELEAVNSGKKKSYESKVGIGRHLKSISVGSHIKDYDSMIVYTHFKGHTMAGFGGSIKNIGMGIPSGTKGKMEIHGDDWEKGPLFLERLVESASAINDLFEDHVVYVNVLKNLSTECDCDANAPAPTMNDIGVLVSDDLLAIEAASMDFIRVAPKNKDLMTHIADIGGYHQIEYGAYLEIGSLAYNLKDINSNDIKLENAMLNGYSVNDIQDIFDSIPDGDSEYGLKHKDYKECIYRDVEPSKGFIELYKSPNGDGIASVAIVVHPEYRHQGIATSLVKKAIAAMGKLKIGRIEWYCKGSNIASIKLAESCGFKIDEQFCNDEWITLYYGFKITDENMITENLILPRSDISYRIAQFSSGEVNKCMVVGFSGSGKTTMGKFLAKALDNCELYELDDLVSNWNFSDANLKEYGDLIYSFFQNPKHKKYRLSRYEELEHYEETEYELPLIIDFIAYTNEYTKSHPDKKIVLEGIWCPYFNIAPDGFNDWAVIVKGTSYLTSEIRATNRNLEGQPLIKRIRNFLHNQSPERIKNISIRMMRGVDKWYNYFKKLNKTMITESTIIDGYDVKKFDKKFIIEYKKKYPRLKHIRDYANGYVILDNDNLVGIVAEDNGWIQGLEVFDPYKNKGFSYKLLDIAINDLKCYRLNVRKTNTIALHTYKKYGFVITEDHDYYYTMEYLANKIAHEAATKRSNLPDSAFGIPEDRKYPLDSEKHVRSAIKLFGHAEESKKKSLAKRIRAAAKKYDIKIPETTQCYKYLTEGAYADIIPENVKNIVFDIGSVLADAHTVDTLLAHLDIPDEYCEEIKDFIYEKFFYGVNQEYKRAVQQFTVEQAKKHYDENAPEHLKPYRDAVFECFGPAMFKYSYDDVLINHFKSKGYHLYYLSNWDRYSYDLETEFFDTLLDDRFDGGLFSFNVGSLLKPDREFFELFLNKYNLDPSDCIFFDDKEENCQAARRLGMYAYTFDKNKTPQMLMGQADIITPPENADDLITVYNSDGTAQNMNISEITWWYVCENRNASNVDEELFYTTLDEAIKYRSTINQSQDFAVLPLYVFTNAHALKQVQDSVPELVLVGQINLFPTGDYEWEIQYPLRLEGGELSSIKEYAMANTNPVIGISKPFLIKVGDQNKPDKLPSNLVFAGDIDPDRGLVVNENHQLEVVDLNGVEILEAYQFNGDKYALERLNQYYKNGTRVDNIYSILTNKSMLSEDQIEYDNDFAKVDFDLIEQKFLAEMATNRDKMIEAMNYNLYRNTITEDSDYHKFPSFIYKYNTLGDIYIKEDFDGVYFYSDLTKKRSASVGSTRLLTENMLKAIL